MASLQRLFLLTLSLLLSYAHARWQCIGVRGRVECPTDRDLINPILIRLADEDTARRDDPMDEGYVSSNGAFELYGCASDPIGTIDPILKIYHKCKGSPKKVVLTVPKDFVGGEYNYTRAINLRDFFQNEDDHEDHVPRCSSVMPGGRNRYFFL